MPFWRKESWREEVRRYPVAITVDTVIGAIVGAVLTRLTGWVGVPDIDNLGSPYTGLTYALLFVAFWLIGILGVRLTRWAIADVKLPWRLVGQSADLGPRHPTSTVQPLPPSGHRELWPDCWLWQAACYLAFGEWPRGDVPDNKDIGDRGGEEFHRAKDVLVKWAAEGRLNTWGVSTEDWNGLFGPIDPETTAFHPIPADDWRRFVLDPLDLLLDPRLGNPSLKAGERYIPKPGEVTHWVTQQVSRRQVEQLADWRARNFPEPERKPNWTLHDAHKFLLNDSALADGEFGQREAALALNKALIDNSIQSWGVRCVNWVKDLDELCMKCPGELVRITPEEWSRMTIREYASVFPYHQSHSAIPADRDASQPCFGSIRVSEIDVRRHFGVRSGANWRSA